MIIYTTTVGNISGYFSPSDFAVFPIYVHVSLGARPFLVSQASPSHETFYARGWLARLDQSAFQENETRVCFECSSLASYPQLLNTHLGITCRISAIPRWVEVGDS